MLKRKNKKGQEEMMGFVLIIMLVIIIGVVFLAFSLRKPSKGILEHKSGEMGKLLHAMMECETECESNSIPQPLKEVVRMCINRESCNNIYTQEQIIIGDNACIIANNTFNDMLDTFLGTNIGERAIHGYSLFLISDEEYNPNLNKIKSEAGEKTGSFFSVSEFIPNPLGAGDSATIEVKLRCYYSKTSEDESN